VSNRQKQYVNEWINERNRQPKSSDERLIPKDCLWRNGFHSNLWINRTYL